MYDNLQKYLLEKGLTIDQGKILVKTDLEAKLRATMVTLQTEIGETGDTTSNTLVGILSQTNATINSSPATYVKSLARMMRTNHRADIREIRLILRDLAAMDVE